MLQLCYKKTIELCNIFALNTSVSANDDDFIVTLVLFLFVYETYNSLWLLTFIIYFYFTCMNDI